MQRITPLLGGSAASKRVLLGIPGQSGKGKIVPGIVKGGGNLETRSSTEGDHLKT